MRRKFLFLSISLFVLTGMAIVYQVSALEELGDKELAKIVGACRCLQFNACPDRYQACQNGIEGGVCYKCESPKQGYCCYGDIDKNCVPSNPQSCGRRIIAVCERLPTGYLRCGGPETYFRFCGPAFTQCTD